jgi:hypothetical protein
VMRSMFSRVMCASVYPRSCVTAVAVCRGDEREASRYAGERRA